MDLAEPHVTGLDGVTVVTPEETRVPDETTADRRPGTVEAAGRRTPQDRVATAGQTVPGAFLRTVAEHGDDVALRCRHGEAPGRQLTWGEWAPATPPGWRPGCAGSASGPAPGCC